MSVTQATIYQAIVNLGLSDKPLCVHASLRSFGWVEGGAPAVMDGLLAAGCTVLVPTFSDEYGVPPLPHMHREHNGADTAWIKSKEWPGVGKIYTPASNAIELAEMGAIPAAVLNRPDRRRGEHPLCSFATVGPQAEKLIANQTPLAVNAPLTALAAAGGYVVLMGVGLESMTLLHLAEQQAGRNLFRRWANDRKGETIEVEMGGCSDGFGNLMPVLAPLMTTTLVGQSLWRIFPAQPTLHLAAEVIRRNPPITHCGKSPCRCDDAVLGGPRLG
ncbi:MAG: AAC(3) family N-acetyltransferase [Caldilineaceae bacterium]